MPSERPRNQALTLRLHHAALTLEFVGDAHRQHPRWRSDCASSPVTSRHYRLLRFRFAVAAATCLGLRFPRNFLFAPFFTRSFARLPVLGTCGRALTADSDSLRRVFLRSIVELQERRAATFHSRSIPSSGGTCESCFGTCRLKFLPEHEQLQGP
jgi:hypothetical protein